MRIEGTADYFSLACLEQHAAEAAVEDAGQRARQASEARGKEHERQVQAKQHAQAAAREGGFWDSVCDLATIGVSVGAVVATGGAGVAGAAALAGLAMTGGDKVLTSSGVIDSKSGLSLGLKIGGGLTSALGVAGTASGMAGLAGQAIAGASGMTGAVGMAAGAVARSESADAEAEVLAHRAARQRLADESHEATSAACDALDLQADASGRAQRFLDREHQQALAVVRA